MGLFNRYCLTKILTLICLFSSLAKADFHIIDLIGGPREVLHVSPLSQEKVGYSILFYQNQLWGGQAVIQTNWNNKTEKQFAGTITALVLPPSFKEKWESGALKIPKNVQILPPREKAGDYVEFFSPGAFHVIGGSVGQIHITGIPEGKIKSWYRWPVIASKYARYHLVSVETENGRQSFLHQEGNMQNPNGKTMPLGDLYIEPGEQIRVLNGILVFEKASEGISLDRIMKNPEHMRATAEEAQLAREMYEVQYEHAGKRLVVRLDPTGAGEIIQIGNIHDDPLDIGLDTKSHFDGVFTELHLPAEKLSEFGTPPALVGRSEMEKDDKEIVSFTSNKGRTFAIEYNSLTAINQNVYQPFTEGTEVTKEERPQPQHQGGASQAAPLPNGLSGNAWKEVKPFALDLRQKVNPNLPRPSAKNQELIDDVFRSLSGFEIASSKILGQPGTGKSYLIEQIAGEIAAGRCPEHLRHAQILMLNLASLQAGEGTTQVIERKIKAMIELSQRNNIVWFVDEAHILRTVGTHRDNPDGVMQLLKPYIQSGVLKIIAVTTPPEWEKSFGDDPAWNRRFETVMVPESQGEEVIKALKGFIQKHQLPEVDPSILKLIVRLSDEFNPMEYQPSKAISLLDKVMADIRVRGPLRAPTVEDVKRNAQRIYRLHPDRFDRTRMRARLEGLVDFINDQVIGQEEAAQAIANSFELSFGGAMEKNKPKGLLIFPGDKGQGKTELVMAAAEGMGMTVKRIVMSSYAYPSQMDALKQAIYQAWQEDPNGVLFFDEIEKADISVQNDLIQLLDSGKFSVEIRTSGRTTVKEVVLRNSHIFMATNAGSSYLRSLRDKSEYNDLEMKQAMIKEKLAYLIIDRMTGGVVPFHYLNIENYKKVVLRHVKKTLKNYMENNPEVRLRLENLRGFIDQTVISTFREKMSNREAVTAMQALKLAIVKAVNRSDDLDNVHVRLSGDRDPKLRRFSAPMCRSAHAR